MKNSTSNLSLYGDNKRKRRICREVEVISRQITRLVKEKIEFKYEEEIKKTTENGNKDLEAEMFFREMRRT